MSGSAFFLGIVITIVMTIVAANTFLGEKLTIWVFVIGLGCTIGYSVHAARQPEYIAQEQKEEREAKARLLAEQTPRVIREADGCKVYTFKAGDTWKYFTRCPASTTTTISERQVSCGKNCRRTETDSIENTTP